MPVPLRVLALLIVVSALALATLAPALADMHPAAADGQRLEDQPPAVQALYNAVYGDDAAAMWIAEHNAAIGASAAPAAAPAQSSYYDRIVAVAMARGADADLANRIAVDVIGRGTEEAFLAGTDTGVLYGVGTSETDINNPPAAAAPASSSGGGGGGGSDSKTISGWGDVDVAAMVGRSYTLTLPEYTSASDVIYDISGTLPTGLMFAAATRVVSGIPASIPDTNPAVVTYRAAVDSNGDGTVGDGEVVATMRVSIKVSDEDDTTPTDYAPSFRDASVDSMTLVQNHNYSGEYAIAALPSGYISPDAGTSERNLTYGIEGLPVGMTFDSTSRVISGAPSDLGTSSVTYTVYDGDNAADADPDNRESATLTFTITVEANSLPRFAKASESFIVVQGASVALPTATGGNGELDYSGPDSPPDGLTIKDGMVTAADTATVGVKDAFTYTVTDGNGDTDTISITVTVNAKTS